MSYGVLSVALSITGVLAGAPLLRRIRNGMTYIVQRKDRFYVVAYDGLDPLTAKQRRRWHPVGHDRHDAELVACRIERDNAGAAPAPVKLGRPVSVALRCID